MKLSIIAFTKNACNVAETLCAGLENDGDKIKGFFISKSAESSILKKIESSLLAWTAKNFNEEDALIFIGATGIAVRAIAPFVKSKDTDPAVICIDELGRFVISLLSGHLGGANELTLTVSEILSATPVITTATDINKKFSVDSWAKSQGLWPVNISAIKAVSAKILGCEDVYLYSSYEIKGNPPENVKVVDKNIFFEHVKSGEVGIYISGEFNEESLRENIEKSAKNKEECIKILWLIPKNIHIGFGCRKGVSQNQVEALFHKVMEENDFKTCRVLDISSIDIKADEPALQSLSKTINVEFKSFSAEALASLEGDFTPSKFVANTVGVDNVCERAAVMASKSMNKNKEAGNIIVKKTSLNGVTIAMVEDDLNISF